MFLLQQATVIVFCAALLQTTSGLSLSRSATFRIIGRCTADHSSSTCTMPMTCLSNIRTGRLGLPLNSIHGDNEETTDAGPTFDVEVNSQDSESVSVAITNNNTSSTPQRKTSGPLGFLRNLKAVNKQSLSKLGMSALLSYGFVSNVSGVLAVSSAWFIFSKRVSNFNDYHIFFASKIT